MSELDDMIRALRAIGAPNLGVQVAARANHTIRAALTATLDAGESPEGEAWAPRKEGGRAYAHAASKISTAAIGDIVRVTLTGPEVYGHYGARGMTVRLMLPDLGAEIPASVTAAITKAGFELLEELTR